MALFRDPLHVKLSLDPAFDELYPPGSAAPYPGIYRCTGCGDEIAIAGGNVLPPQNHRQHPADLSKIEWQLLVYPEQQK